MPENTKNPVANNHPLPLGQEVATPSTTYPAVPQDDRTISTNHLGRRVPAHWGTSIPGNGQSSSLHGTTSRSPGQRPTSVAAADRQRRAPLTAKES